jgi:hypothetical protein
MEVAMQPTGMEEEKTAYLSDDPRKLIGQFRRLGEAGPAYEIMAIDDTGNVDVEIVYSDEKFRTTLAEVLNDPIAETLP